MIGLLVSLLIASNGAWLVYLFDTAVSASYRDTVLQEHHEALAQALAILPVAAAPDATREDVIAAAEGAANEPNSFQKDGFLWIGQLGLKFGPGGRLTEVEPSWSPF